MDNVLLRLLTEVAQLPLERHLGQCRAHFRRAALLSPSLRVLKAHPIVPVQGNASELFKYWNSPGIIKSL